MRYETKKGLLPTRPITISCVYKNKSKEGSYAEIIANFTTNPTVRTLLYDFVNNLPFAISIKQLKFQLNLLEPLTTDEQIRIINKTISHRWNSLRFEYEKLIKRRVKYDY